MLKSGLGEDFVKIEHKGGHLAPRPRSTLHQVDLAKTVKTKIVLMLLVLFRRRNCTLMVVRSAAHHKPEYEK